MNNRTQLLAKLVRDGIYVVDGRAVAEAMMVRRTARRTLPGITFPGESKRLVRSFRRAEHARSFRLAEIRRRTPAH